MIVIFSHIKGGVGKSTLCALLANYWSAKGLSVCIYDADPQRSLARQRMSDEKVFSNHKFNYPVNELNILDDSERTKFLSVLSKKKEIVLVDMKAGMDKAGVDILSKADYVIVPFRFDPFVVRSSGVFFHFMENLKKYNTLKVKPIFVPNDIESASAEDEKIWKQYEDKMAKHCIVTARILSTPEFKKRNTAFITEKEKKAVENCFEQISKIILPQI